MTMERDSKGRVEVVAATLSLSQARLHGWCDGGMVSAVDIITIRSSIDADG